MRQITIEEAESVAGKRLDRRRKYATTDDGKPDDCTGHLLFSLGSWTETCTGCFESEDGYPIGAYAHDPKHGCYVGDGCPECGYTGKRRMVMWLPHIEPVEG
ncbi:hypothetical protein [Azospirillum sp. TSO5]|uniref:hypothetical protein n=1 Tax=Azospirillum sp. TSO5 TaxID=716760 RepID=UPI000D65B212|nr:hypothetical protein [Azospirillum sp. TSO5]